MTSTGPHHTLFTLLRVSVRVRVRARFRVRVRVRSTEEGAR